MFILCFLFIGWKDTSLNHSPADPSATSAFLPVNKALVLQLVNDARANGRTCGSVKYQPVPVLSWNDLLEKAASEHSRDMEKKKYFSHIDPKGADAGERMGAAGYNWKNYGENIGIGYQNEKEVIEGWLNSEGHCRNIMNPKFTEMGVGRSGSYWTEDFGSR